MVSNYVYCKLNWLYKNFYALKVENIDLILQSLISNCMVNDENKLAKELKWIKRKWGTLTSWTIHDRLRNILLKLDKELTYE